MTKTLENYFDGWIIVESSISKIPCDDQEKHDWCVNNIGIRSLRWDTKMITPSPIKRGKMVQNVWHVWHYMFRSDADAMMFVLTFGGNIINKQQHNN